MFELLIRLVLGSFFRGLLYSIFFIHSIIDQLIDDGYDHLLGTIMRTYEITLYYFLQRDLRTSLRSKLFRLPSNEASIRRFNLSFFPFHQALSLFRSKEPF